MNKKTLFFSMIAGALVASNVTAQEPATSMLGNISFETTNSKAKIQAIPAQNKGKIAGWWVQAAATNQVESQQPTSQNTKGYCPINTGGAKITFDNHMQLDKVVCADGSQLRPSIRYSSGEGMNCSIETAFKQHGLDAVYSTPPVANKTTITVKTKCAGEPAEHYTEDSTGYNTSTVTIVAMDPKGPSVLKKTVRALSTIKVP